MNADNTRNPQEGEPNNAVGQDEMTNNDTGNWEQQAKYFQSEKDKLQTENQKLKQYEEIGQFLESRPDIVGKIMNDGSGQPQQAQPIQKPESFDPWEAYNDPSSESYKYRMQEMQTQISSAVGQATQGIQKQASRTTLKGKLADSGLNPEEVSRFMKFAEKHPSEYGLDNVIKMWRAVSGDPTQVSNIQSNANPLDKIRQVQSEPQTGGVLQGQRPQAPDSDDEAMWKGVLGASRVGNKIP